MDMTTLQHTNYPNSIVLHAKIKFVQLNFII